MQHWCGRHPLQACNNYKFTNVKSHKHLRRHELQKARVTSCTRREQNPFSTFHVNLQWVSLIAQNSAEAKKICHRTKLWDETTCCCNRMTTVMMELNTDCFVRWCLGLIRNKYTCKPNQCHTTLTFNCTPSTFRPTHFASLELEDWTTSFRQWHLARPSSIPPTHTASLALCLSFASCQWRSLFAIHDADLPQLRKLGIDDHPHCSPAPPSHS